MKKEEKKWLDKLFSTISKIKNVNFNSLQNGEYDDLLEKEMDTNSIQLAGYLCPTEWQYLKRKFVLELKVKE